MLSIIKYPHHAISLNLKLFILVQVLFCARFGQAQTVKAPVITGTSTGGVGYVVNQADASGLSATIGRFDTPYPYPDTKEQAPGLEPDGVSVSYIDIDVNDGGTVTFSYRLRTYDAEVYNWFDIYLETSRGTKTLVDHIGKPGSDYGSYFATAPVNVVVKLNEYRNTHVRFVFSVQQDGWGDQTQGSFNGFQISNCSVAPLPAITDPVAQAIESGATSSIDIQNLTPPLQSALQCFQGSVANVGGTFRLTSAYRNPAYQRHLREVWDRWRQIHNSTEAECQDLRNEIIAEFKRHGLQESQQPASDSGPHTSGKAFDARISLPSTHNVDIVAAGCGLFRPLSGPDPVHFQLK